ncbi:MAG TPA: catalase-related domain-containing protein [Nostocaceae cyanobacterium]|nr:catalase-related domain-containing protein [Nostocaceae cyanobacterium]
MIQNIVGSLGQARRDLQMRQLCHFFRADVNYGKRIANTLGIENDPAMLPK